MQTLHTFQAIATQTLAALITVWPLSFLAFAVAAVAFVAGANASVTNSRTRRLLILANYASPVIAMLIGALLAYDMPRGSTHEEPSAWKGLALWLPVLASGACIVVLIMRAPGARMRSVALAVPGLWLTFCSTMVAGMAIAGVGS
jgi:hypothetical protein